MGMFGKRFDCQAHRFGNGVAADAAAPFRDDGVPRHAGSPLLQYIAHQNARPEKRRLSVADFRVTRDVTAHQLLLQGLGWLQRLLNAKPRPKEAGRKDVSDYAVRARVKPEILRWMGSARSIPHMRDFAHQCTKQHQDGLVPNSITIMCT